MYRSQPNSQAPIVACCRVRMEEDIDNKDEEEPRTVLEEEKADEC
jgi:hypothetical protein